MKKIIIIIIIGTIFIACVLCFAFIFSPGTYSNVKKYELNYSEEEISTAINVLKKKHPELVVPEVTINNTKKIELLDGKSKQNSNLQKFYFYIKDENKILYIWISPDNKNKTTLAFVSVNHGLNLGNWKHINKDLSTSENDSIIEKFEKLILNNLQNELNED